MAPSAANSSCTLHGPHKNKKLRQATTIAQVLQSQTSLRMDVARCPRLFSQDWENQGHSLYLGQLVELFPVRTRAPMTH
eukprot:1239035-Amphidinium_carterae.1